MKPSFFCLVVVLAASTVVCGQQPNSGTSRMVFNGQDGPPYPINPVNIQRGVLSSVFLQGLPNAQFLVGESNQLAAFGLPFANGFVDINLVTGFSININGFVNPIWTIDGTGNFFANFTLSQTTPLNSSRSFQAAVADFTNPAGIRLSAATRVIVVPGITTTQIASASLGSDNYTAFSLTPFGFTIPFYSQSYSQVFVNANGFLSFGNGDTNYIPDSSSFLSGVPRLAAFWDDLDPLAGGTVTMLVDQTSPVPFITCTFTNVQEAYSYIPHNFSMTVYSQVGDVILNVGGQNPQPLIPTVVGITPGSSLGTQPPKDLSSLNIANYPQGGLLGAANENFHQYFPVPPGLPVFDLAGRTITCTGIGIGSPGARYQVLCTP